MNKKSIRSLLNYCILIIICSSLNSCSCHRIADSKDCGCSVISRDENTIVPSKKLVVGSLILPSTLYDTSGVAHTFPVKGQICGALLINACTDCAKSKLIEWEDSQKANPKVLMVVIFRNSNDDYVQLFRENIKSHMLYLRDDVGSYFEKYDVSFFPRFCKIDSTGSISNIQSSAKSYSTDLEACFPR